MRIFLTSDCHFGHKNIIEYCNRPFETVEEMNEEMIRRWNSVVTPSDRVFFLGDFALGGKERAIEWGKRLNGRKVFIYGNHDHLKPCVYYEAGFEHVSKWPIVIQNEILLSHAPFEPRNGAYNGLFNIHGHVHDKCRLAPTVSDVSACVCVERWDYYPVDLNRIIKDRRRAKGI